MTYKFECEDASIFITCASITKALSYAQEMDMTYIGEATKEDLNDECDICQFDYDVMNLEQCPNCGNNTFEES